MEDSVSSVSLLEMAGLNTLLDPYEGPGYIRNSISTLQEYTLDMTGALRRFQRWVDSTQREMDTGFPPKDDVRRLFQEFSENITQYIEGLSKLSRFIYHRLIAYQRDDITDRDTLAEVHKNNEQANLELGRLTYIWLLMQHTSRCMLFGSPEHDPEAEHPVQPPPSPSSDSGFEIIIEQAFAFQSASDQGIKPRDHSPPSTEREKAASPTYWWHFALAALKDALRLLRIFSC